MAEILFVTWDGGGNVPPALGIAAALTARGHAVRFVGHPGLRSYLPTTGDKNRRQMIEGAPQFAGQMQAQMDKGRDLDNEPITDEERGAIIKSSLGYGH